MTLKCHQEIALTVFISSARRWYKIIPNLQPFRDLTAYFSINASRDRVFARAQNDKTKSFSCFWRLRDVRYSVSKENLSIKFQSVGTTSVRGYDSLKVRITQILIKITGSITIKCRCFSIGTFSIIKAQVFLMQHMVLRVAHK